MSTSQILSQQPGAIGIAGVLDSNAPVAQKVEQVSMKIIGLIPVVGPIVNSVLGPIFSAIGASHAAAVAKEAQTINTCFPAWINSVINTMNALSMGEITEADAISDLNTAASTYKTCVAGIIKESSPCQANCLIGQTDADVATCSGAATKPSILKTCKAGQANAFPQSPYSISTTGQFGTYPYNCNAGSTCNAACAITCMYIEPTTTGLINIINEGGGTWVINASKQNGAIAPTPAVTITYKKPSLLEVMDRNFLADLHLSSSVTGGSTSTGNLELVAILGVTGVVILSIIVLRHRGAA